MAYMKLFITGGHLTPALAVIDEIKLKYPSWEIVFIGRKYAMEGDRKVSEEYRVIEYKKIRFLPITTGRLTRYISITTVASLIKLPIGFMQAIYYCLFQRPRVIASFGGYIALPIVIAGWLFRIPIITHEQTSVPGLANRIISLFASSICVNSSAIAHVFPKKKTVVTGMIFRKSLFAPLHSHVFSLPVNVPVLYITGGTTGSLSVNKLLYPIIQKLLAKYTIIHQAGQRSLARALQIRDKLSAKEGSRYIVMPYLDEEKHVWAMQNAHIVIGRSGANIVAEVEALGKVALFIPLPWSSYNEQFMNAKRLADAGSSIILEQKNASPQKILHMIAVIENQFTSFESHAQSISKNISLNGAQLYLFRLVSLTV